MRSLSRSLKHVRAAQLRARVIRWAIVQSALGTLFLIGALAYALGPSPDAPASRFWIPALVVLSTFHAAMGLRGLARTRRWPGRGWLVATLLWGCLSTLVMRFLLRR